MYTHSKQKQQCIKKTHRQRLLGMYTKVLFCSLCWTTILFIDMHNLKALRHAYTVNRFFHYIQKWGGEDESRNRAIQQKNKQKRNGVKRFKYTPTAYADIRHCVFELYTCAHWARAYILYICTKLSSFQRLIPLYLNCV